MKIFVASDHAGLKVKSYALSYLTKFDTNNFEVIDLSPKNKEGDDYPDFAKKVSLEVQKNDALGVLVCGTGIGVSIVANKFKGIRAALCASPLDARLSRAHNDANILVLSGRTKKKDAENLVGAFFEAKFEKGRHSRRINKIKKLESALNNI